MHRTGDEDDALFQQAREDVIGPFTARGLFNHHGNKVHVGFDGIVHMYLPALWGLACPRKSLKSLSSAS